MSKPTILNFAIETTKILKRNYSVAIDIRGKITAAEKKEILWKIERTLNQRAEFDFRIVANSGEQVSYFDAKKIMDENFYGSATIAGLFDENILSTTPPPLPFSRATLEQAKKDGKYLILFVDKDADGNPLTAKRMNELVQARLDKEGKGEKFLYSAASLDCWYKDEKFFTDEVPRAGWKLVTPEVKDSAYKTWDEQEELIQKENGTRLSFSEAIYVLATVGNDFLKNRYVWTSSRNSDGELVNLGYSDVDGSSVAGVRPDDWRGGLLASFSRSQD